jgi:GTPase
MLSELIDDTSDTIKLKPEIEEGNVEYKLRLDTKSLLGIKKTGNQMQWRLTEGKKLTGKYEASYVFGVLDDGTPGSISEEEIDSTISIFKKIVNNVGCRILSISKIVINKISMIAIVKVCKEIDIVKKHETNILVVSPSGVGKTTLMSRLVHDQTDNGCGFARTLSFQHEHEKETGVTSSIKRDFIGFKDEELINYSSGFGTDMEDIYEESDRFITIDDLPGDPKYIKTTLYGILSKKHNVVLMGIPSVDTKAFLEEHEKFYHNMMIICKLFKIAPLFMITKIDLVKKEDIPGIIKIINDHIGITMTNIEDHIDDESIDFQKVYYLLISNISSEGISTLIKYINEFSKSISSLSPLPFPKSEVTEDILFITNEIFKIPETRTIMYGYLKYGSLNIGDKINLFTDGSLYTCKIKSIHKKLAESESIIAGETGCITLESSDKIYIDKTSILISDSMKRCLKTEVEFIPHSELPPKKSYHMYNGSTIHSVNLYPDEININLNQRNESRYLFGLEQSQY